MNRIKLTTVVFVIGAVAVAGLMLPHALAQAGSGTDHTGHTGNMNMERSAKTGVLSLESIHSKHIPMVVTSIDKAKTALESGDRKAVLTELNKARRMLLAIDKSIATYVKPKFVNDHCPIMGTAINTDKVTKDLIRDYKDKKVAFCCAGCPAAWDKLTDAQKQAKLAKVKAEPAHIHPSNTR